MRLILSSLISLGWAGSVAAHEHPSSPSAALTYLGNEAILVHQGETKVLFDPLFHQAYGQYQLVPETMRADIMAGNAPFDGIDVVFISHAHGDHFDAQDANQYMGAHQNVRFVMPQQAMMSMQDAPNWQADYAARITVIDLAYKADPVSISIGHVSASAVRIPHAGWPDPRRVSVQNIVYRVRLNADADAPMTVMHMGDADVNTHHYAPFSEHWAAQRTDTAFPPYWFFLRAEGPDILYQDMNVERAIGVHVPVNVPQDLIESGADYFSRPGEQRPYK